MQRAMIPGLLCALLAAAAPPDITHLQLRLAIDDVSQSLEGVEEVSYTTSGASQDVLSFGQRGLEILRADGEYRIEKDRLEIRLPGAAAGAQRRVHIHYRARPKRGLYFHRAQVWQFDAWDDWMPNPADPDERMTWEFDAEVRADWQVVSNGELAGVEDRGARRVFRWRQPVPARLEGFTFAAGNFEVFQQGRVYHYVPAGAADAATVMRSLGRAPRMLDLFSREFGYPYPFGAYRQVVLWDYHPQGTEHLGLSCLSENKLVEERSRLDADDYIVAHELAHTWWHMLVAPRSRAHVWLSEGFAVYFGIQFFEAAEGRDEFEYRLRRRLRLYLDEDRRYRRVLVTDEPVPGELDEHIYSRGAYILHMLRRWLGDERFFDGLRRFAGQHAYSRADSADLERAMEQAAGRPLDWYFHQWLYHKGYPVLKVSRQWNPGSVTLRIEQTQPEEAFRVPVRIEVGAEAHEEMLENRTEMRTYAVRGRPRYIRFDADHRLLATVDFPRPAEELIRQLQEAPDAMGRTEAAEALRGPEAQQTREAHDSLRHALQFDLFHGVREAAAASLSREGEAPALLDALGRETDSRVLQAIVGALEPFAGRPEVESALKRAATGQLSPYVRAGALLALARARAAGTFALLLRALGENAHRDVVRAAAFQGFAALGDTRAVPEIVRYLQSEQTTRWAREPAVNALGKLAGSDPQVKQLLEQIHAQDFWPGVREAAGRIR